MKRARILEIMLLLLDKRKITSSELANRFEVSIRTIYRDIDLLSEIGIPIYTTTGKNGGVHLMEGFSLDKSLLLENEQRQLFLALQSINTIPGVDIKSVKQKLSSLFAFNQSSNEWIEIDFSNWFEDKDFYGKIKKAILERRVIRFTYLNGRGEELKRDINPRKLLFRYKSWYLYGFCHVRNEYRMFKISRVRNLKLLEKQFDDEYFEVPQLNNKDTTENMLHLELEFSIDVAPYVYDLFDQKNIKHVSKDIIQLSLDHKNEEWLYNCLMFFGNKVTVIEPESVKCELILRHKRAYEHMKNIEATK